MRYGDAGPEVQRMQLALVRAGLTLPRFGADGDFGRETAAAVARFAASLGLAWDAGDDVPPAVLDALGIDGDPATDESAGPLDLEGVALFDLRHEASDPHRKSKTDRRGRTVRRAAQAIDSICLHQTGIAFGRPRRDPSDLGLARRSLDVACHAMAFRAGFLAWPADLSWYIYHANALNRRSLGLEIEGNLPGLIGGKVWRGEATEVSDDLVHAARMGVKLLVTEGRRAGCPIRYLYAHRQADAWRRADPGEELWRRVGLEYAVEVLGLEPRPAETFGHPSGSARRGLPVPGAWGPAGVGRY